MPPSPDPPRSTARSDVFEALVVEALRRLDVGGEAAFAAFCAEHGEHEDELRTAITRLRDSGLLADPRDVAGRGIPERVGEFRLIERIGGGGMGVVYAAIQEPLGRQVAVKLMRPEHVYFDDSHARFRREVEAVARLAHPGIVAIHTVGDAGGLPYYAMEFVEGRSLAQVLRELKDRPPEDLTAQDLGERRTGSGGGWVETVVRIVRDVARALAHAHARGVLHRDVKPSNVMLTPEHEVRLVDFGLAEVADAGRLTRSGAQLGSLHYMAPEQVLGRGGEIGPRTDVYGLGVTLYELLTLRVPFDAPDPRALQRRVVEGHPPSPRRFNRQLSDDLVTVCACALDPEPGRRYASMADLEQDLSSLLAFRPICARRAGVLRRARWWARRHPAAALAVALGLFIVVGGPIGYVVQERRARARVEGALERADRRLEDARGVLGVASQVARELLHQPGNEEARRRLREKTVEFYLSALEEDRDDPSAVRFGASVRRELARDRRFGGDYAGAEAPLREAIALLEGLPRAERTAWADMARAAVLQDLGGTLVPQGDVVEAMELFEQASAIVDATLARDPRDVQARDQSARIRWRMGLAARSRGDLAAAEELLLEAAAIERGLVADSGDPPRVAALANTLRNIASVRREAGHLDVALAGAREAYERVSWALARDPEERFARMEHAYVLAELALALGAQGANDEAERHFAVAVAAARALHAQGAWDLNALRALVWVELEQAEHVERRDPARCADLLPELEAAAATLLQQSGELPLVHSYTSRVAVLRAGACARRADPDGAAAALARAVEHARRAAELAPANEAFRRALDELEARAARR